jgi:branched-chain amino acid transport system substrate-binding protein
VLSDMSGPYADSSGSGAVAAARLAVEDKHIKVEIVSAEHRDKPDIGASIVRIWLHD